jgi:hypothetical protein
MKPRRETRTWRKEATPSESVAQVRDPADRALWLVRRRALLMEVAEIERRCGLVPDEEDDPLTA